MKNIEKLEKIGILGVVRKRQGAADENDDTYDEYINNMDDTKLVEQWAGWYLGDGSWWTQMKELFDKLVELNETKNIEEL
jgi:hypothetical protein